MSTAVQRGVKKRPKVASISLRQLTGRSQLTPTQVAAAALNDALNRFSDMINPARRQELVNEFSGYELAPHLHMATLAVVLVYIDRYLPGVEPALFANLQNVPTLLPPERFTDAQLNPLLERVFPTETDPVHRNKRRQDLLRYLLTVMTWRLV